MDLRWQCPGRRSPSVHSVSQAGGDKKSGAGGSESASSSKAAAAAAAVTEFDFDEEFADTSAATAKLTSIPNRRKTGNQTSELFLLFVLFASTSGFKTFFTLLLSFASPHLIPPHVVTDTRSSPCRLKESGKIG
jgi:hypothetical protein